MTSLPISELCIFRAIALVMDELERDDAPHSIIKWRCEQVARLLLATRFPAEVDVADQSRTTRTFGDFASAYRGDGKDEDPPP